jgi:hypothetical protein
MNNVSFARDRFFLLCAPPLILLSPVIATIKYLSLPYNSKGIILVILAIAAIAFFLGTVASLCHGRGGLYSVLKVTALTVTMLLAIDLTSNQLHLTALLDSRSHRGAFFLVAALLIFALLWILRDRIAFILFAGSIAFFLSTALITPAAASEHLDPVVYLIFDESIGLDGIDQSIPGGKEAYTLLRSTFEKHGFRIYGAAFSRHYTTTRSIPALLNFNWKENYAGRVSRYSFDFPNRPEDFKKLALFDLFIKRGYKIKVYQTRHINFCGAAKVECKTYPSFDPKSKFITENPDGSAPFDGDKIVLATLTQAFSFSSLINRLSPLVSEAFPKRPDLITPTHFDAFGFEQWFTQFSQSVLNDNRGVVHFGHFLVPHNPGVLDDNCKPQARWEKPYYLFEAKGLSGHALDAARLKDYQWYFAQVSCVAKKLDAFLTKLDRAPAFKTATIVVHGDHGSRISAGSEAENLTDRDMVDNFSTLYAIKGPDIVPGYDERSVSIQRLTAEYFSGESKAGLGDDPLTVAVDSKDGVTVVPRKMPKMNAGD